jgi:hypothetical protein
VNAFGTAFSAAQIIMLEREALGKWWPLLEIWQDKTRKHMSVIENVIDPILKNALKKRQEDGVDAESLGRKVKVVPQEVAEGETLLEHLVKVTEGKKMSALPQVFSDIWPRRSSHLEGRDD